MPICVSNKFHVISSPFVPIGRFKCQTLQMNSTALNKIKTSEEIADFSLMMVVIRVPITYQFLKARINSFPSQEYSHRYSTFNY